MPSESPKLEQIRRTVNNTSIGQNAVQSRPSRGSERSVGQNFVTSQSEKSILKSPNSISNRAHRSTSVQGRSSSRLESSGPRPKERAREIVENAHAGSGTQTPEDDSAKQSTNNRSKSATSMTYTRMLEYSSSSSLRRPNSTAEFGQRKKLVEGLTEDELGYITRVNTKKNANRNLKSRFTRAKLAIESISTSHAMDALPVVSPAQEGASGIQRRGRSASPSSNLLAVANEELFQSAESSDSLGFDIEPATVDANELALSLSSFSDGRSTPSVRISTVRTVVLIPDPARKGRASVEVEEEDREHPSRATARALVPRSLQPKKGDFSRALSNSQNKKAPPVPRARNP